MSVDRRCPRCGQVIILLSQEQGTFVCWFCRKGFKVARLYDGKERKGEK